MKKDLHPPYYPTAKIRCACGHQWSVGSTQPELSVEICSRCHPFFSGQEKIVDTSGRVEKFKKRQEKTQKKMVRRSNPRKKK